MTDRVSYLTVALEQDIRTDDVEFLVNAIKALRYVQNVEMGISDPAQWTERMRIKSELRTKLWSLLDELN